MCHIAEGTCRRGFHRHVVEAVTSCHINLSLAVVTHPVT